MTASVGTSRAAVLRWSMNCMVTNMPGANAKPGLASCTRAFSVRVAVATSGNMAWTVPLNTLPGTATERASTFAPACSNASWLSGISASAHTVAKLLMRASVVPGVTVMPSRATSSATTPLLGTTKVVRACGLPLASTRTTWASVMPASSRRWRAAATNGASLPAAFLMAKNSCCAATHSGTYRSANGCPARTVSSVARTYSFSIKPLARACITDWSRSFQAMLPMADNCVVKVPCTTSAVRKPRFCCTRGLTVTLLPSPGCAPV